MMIARKSSQKRKLALTLILKKIHLKPSRIRRILNLDIAVVSPIQLRLSSWSVVLKGKIKKQIFR